MGSPQHSTRNSIFSVSVEGSYFCNLTCLKQEKIIRFRFKKYIAATLYGHYSDVQLVIWWRKTYIRVKPPAHCRSAGKPPHKKLSYRPGLEATRWMAWGFQVSYSNRSATGATCYVMICLARTKSVCEILWEVHLPVTCVRIYLETVTLVLGSSVKI